MEPKMLQQMGFFVSKDALQKRNKQKKEYQEQKKTNRAKKVTKTETRGYQSNINLLLKNEISDLLEGFPQVQQKKKRIKLNRSCGAEFRVQMWTQFIFSP